MLRTAFAFAIAGLIFAGGSATVRAAPILPLPSATTAGLDNVVDVQWRRRCWRDRWGRALSRWRMGSSLLARSLGQQALPLVISTSCA
jgi:hypothetical protein